MNEIFDPTQAIKEAQASLEQALLADGPFKEALDHTTPILRKLALQLYTTPWSSEAVRTETLAPLLPLLTAADPSPEAEEQRYYLYTDFVTHTELPFYLDRLYSLTKKVQYRNQAKKLRALPAVVSFETLNDTSGPLTKAAAVVAELAVPITPRFSQDPYALLLAAGHVLVTADLTTFYTAYTEASDLERQAAEDKIYADTKSDELRAAAKHADRQLKLASVGIVAGLCAATTISFESYTLRAALLQPNESSEAWLEAVLPIRLQTTAMLVAAAQVTTVVPW